MVGSPIPCYSLCKPIRARHAGASPMFGVVNYRFLGIDWSRLGLAHEHAPALDLDDSPARRDCHCLRPIVRVEFLHDVLNVDFHGFLGNIKPVRDVSVPIAARNVPKHLDLTFG